MTAKSWVAMGLAALIALPAQASEGTLDKVKRTGTVALGIREASYPLSYLDEMKKPIGYHIDICHRIVDAVKAKLSLPGLKVQYVPVTSQNRITMLAGGQIDLECGSTTNNEARQTQVAFAPTTYLATVRMAVRKESGITDIAQLAGKTVVTTSGSTGIELLRENPIGRKLDFHPVYGKDHADSFAMLETSAAAAFVMDDNLLAGLIMTSRTPSAFEIVGRPLDLQPIAIMYRKNDPAFKQVVDGTVAGLMKSGEINRLYTKWFESPIPPKDISLNFAMSEVLKLMLRYPDSSPAESFRPTE
ncbi:MAG: transporter substrate-binding domain-containing protein [Solirubrobacterales bacterium]